MTWNSLNLQGVCRKQNKPQALMLEVIHETAVMRSECSAGRETTSFGSRDCTVCLYLSVSSLQLKYENCSSCFYMYRSSWSLISSASDWSVRARQRLEFEDSQPSVSVVLPEDDLLLCLCWLVDGCSSSSPPGVSVSHQTASGASGFLSCLFGSSYGWSALFTPVNLIGRLLPHLSMAVRVCAAFGVQLLLQREAAGLFMNNVIYD